MSTEPRDETGVRVRSAAVDLFAKKGFTAVGIREIADAAGIKTATLYHYMTAKEDLLVDIMTSVIKPLTEAATAAVREYERPSEQLVCLMEMHVWVHGGRPRSTLVSDTELRSLSEVALKEISLIRDEYEDIWRNVVRAGRKSGEFTVEHDTVTTSGLLTLGTGVAHWYRLGGAISLAELCSMHSDLALALVRAQDASGAIRRPAVQVGPPREVLSPDPSL